MNCVEETSKQTSQILFFAFTLCLSKKAFYSCGIKMCQCHINGYTFTFYLALEKSKTGHKTSKTVLLIEIRHSSSAARRVP